MIHTFGNIDIVLVGTLSPGNIGSAARAMHNMGLSNLRLAEPRCEIDETSFWMATHGEKVLRGAEVFSDLRGAVGTAAYVCGTTARNRKQRKFTYPKQMAEKVLSLAESNRVAIVFGPEDAGLNNSQLELCSEVVSIPTVEEASSLNISQAVMIICYELFCAGSGSFGGTKKRSLAPAEESEEMYDHMREVLLETQFLNPQNPDVVLGKFRRILTRAGLGSREVRMIRGIFRQLLWFVRRAKSLPGWDK